MSLELREGLAFHRKLSTPLWEEKTFADNLEAPQHQEGIRLDRLVILPAYQDAVCPVLERHIDQGDLTPVIEVGCGTGSFSQDLAPEWLKPRLVSFDLNMHSLKFLAEKDSDAQLFRGSSYRIPIRDDAVSTLIGFSSFDSMLYLPVALGEVRRVLMPRGKLLLFQDLTTDLYESGKGSGLRSAEDYHKILIEEAENQGFIILEGTEDLLEAESVEPITSVRERIPEFELDEMPFPLIMIWDRGYVWPPRTRSSDTRNTQNTKEEIMEDLAQGIPKMQKEGLFDNLDAKAGDLISVLKMRHLVLQKPL